ncbi:Flp pilus assembly protein CpaB [Aminobacterium mobile]|uniref:Flp pilus assembly protein CpaB n=1 Tax=Aminobacterium mobile TaxID=81467 RepID=UPI000463977A|nr:Flp pilus assembly protein CpaB [Aminobacterium mobile]
MKKRGIFLIVSLLLGTMAGLLVYQQIRSYKQKIARAERELISVVVATRPKDAFSIITSEDVKAVRMPRSSIPVEEVLSLDDVVGKASMMDLSTGDPVLKNKLSLDPEKLGVAFQLANGRLAIALPIDEVRATGGLLKPGDYVDIFHVYREKDVETPTSRLLLSRVKVLAIGGVMARKEEKESTKEKQMVAQTAVVEVSPEEAAVAAWAQSLGNLWLALRPAQEETPTSLVVYRGPDVSNPAPLKTASAEPVKARSVKKVVPRTPQGWKIEMIQPGNITTVTVPSDGRSR